jgi:hypothetical protein
MKTLPLIGLLVACCAISTLWAAEPAPAKPAAPPAAAPAKPAATPAKPATAESATPKSDEDSKVKEADKATDDKAAGKPKPAATAADKSSPQRFVPSEQVRADFDVSFPIDI